MKDVTIISAEEKEILLKNTAIIKNIASHMQIYLVNHKDKRDMGLGEMDVNNYCQRINELNQSIDAILEIL